MNRASKKSQQQKSVPQKKEAASDSTTGSQQISWHRIPQPAPTSNNKIFLIIAGAVLVLWMIALGVLAWIS